MTVFIITGKFKKDSNGCATMSLPYEESKDFNLDREYVITIQPLIGKREVKRGVSSKIIIRA